MIMNEHAVPRPGPVDRAETIERRFQSMHRASRELPAFTAAQRKAMLRGLRDVIRAHAGEFAQAIAYDFGWRSHHETLMTEVVPALGIIKDALSNLDRWMRPERRRRSLSFWPARNRVYWQPKGVVLIVAPWNYPMQLAMAPLAAAVAAGNRVILKPSETAPATAQLLKRHVEEALGSDAVTVATGGAEMAEMLCRLPFDHILFTGSTAVGRLVMQAAAHNLTPVTLELGGKSPAIVHGDFDHALAAARIARGKLLNAGQTCIAPDYALVRRDRVDAFVRLFREKAAAFYPSLVDNRDYTSIIDDRHYGRLAGLLADARAKGARVDTIDPAGELGAGETGVREKRRMLPALVIDPPPEAALMREEIFGPILPVVPYDTLEAAIAFVAARPRPLALYYFDDDRARVDQVLRSTVSGGASINDTIFHFAQEGLPFGGIGESGMGSYHGYEGFRTFSHGKGVFLQARRNFTDLLMPPYGARFRRLIGFAVRRNG
jgi:acyl-CoA reductase-like NAD-dependent aldehyde dehydrogenase